MPLSIYTNLLACNTARNLGNSYSRLSASARRLASGLRVNSAADDAAGLAIRELMRADVSALHQGIRNANDAISMIQTADGALQVIDEKLIRMKELAEQAATGTYDSTQRLMIDREFQAMAAEINRIAKSTDFNGIKLLDGSRNGVHDGSGLTSVGAMKIHFGTGNDSAEDYYYAEIPPADITGLHLGGFVKVEEVSFPASPPDQWTVMNADISTAVAAIAEKDVTILGAYYTGHKNSLGVFSNGQGAGLDASMSDGLILSSGKVTDAEKPPKGEQSTNMHTPGDSYLNTLIGGNTEDAAVVDITFTTASSMIYFNFVFATEEYPDYLNTAFNDVCGIFLDGPGNNYTLLENIISIDQASVPAGLAGPITLNNIFNNPALFVDNHNGDNSFAANGYSRTMRIGIPVTPNVPHTLHISVADRGDKNLDSWFLINGISGDETSPQPQERTVAPVDLSTQQKAQYTLGRIGRAIVIKDNIRAHLGAMQNRLENTVTNLRSQADNLQAAESRISDVDVATEVAEFTRNQILTQSATAMLAQANFLPRILVDLLDG